MLEDIVIPWLNPNFAKIKMAVKELASFAGWGRILPEMEKIKGMAGHWWVVCVGETNELCDTEECSWSVC